MWSEGSDNLNSLIIDIEMDMSITHCLKKDKLSKNNNNKHACLFMILIIFGKAYYVNVQTEMSYFFLFIYFWDTFRIIFITCFEEREKQYIMYIHFNKDHNVFKGPLYQNIELIFHCIHVEVDSTILYISISLRIFSCSIWILQQSEKINW